ncbi:MAG: 30S ribosomal protein S25e [Thermoprotei archaeon]|nr:MAG: 30S ribosomal protein S25e [Thermoprotei archaeon]
MGGKKKLTITQMEKRQQVLQRRQQERERRAQQAEMRQEKIALVSDELMKTIASEIAKWKCITPYEVATKYSLKISTARKILRTLHSQGIITLVDKGRRVEIYIPAKASS